MKPACRNVLLFIPFLLAILPHEVAGQCCGVGGGSPIASDISQSVLLPRQIEFNANYQSINSTKFLSGSTPDKNYLDRFSSNYQYFRIAYGLSPTLTFSVESGYWLNKTQVGLNRKDTISSTGIGDLILFPRLNLFKRNQAELTVGLGIKIPLGGYNDSTGFLEPFSGNILYLTNPPAVQTSSGANDFIFNIFYAKAYPMKRLRFFANALYIVKGWNPSGEHFGNYASLGLFAGYSIKRNLSALVQVKGESIGMMQVNPVIMTFAFPSYDPAATGSRKVFVVPQINWNPKKGLNLFINSDIPIYQYVNKTQIASMLQVTAGVSYRFILPSRTQEDEPGSALKTLSR